MPTPVSTARQCLTDEAARALDDAVAVARRRSHAQTTSLHAVSALLALPSSSLREACARARSSAYSPRLQFRALELSVGVSLDRLPSSKSVDEPPVSNSLMAAIKRSQANQRRHPENFHLHQIHTAQQNASVLKVELKHFILSILDDPIVSRVFGEAGFRRCDIKLGIVRPPVSPGSRLSRTRFPPIFLCNLPNSEPGQRSFSFPFAGSSGYEDGDVNTRRIGEVLVRKIGKNPLLVGVCATDALGSFVECVQKGKGVAGILPAEVSELSVVCIEKEVSEFVVEGGSEEKMGLKFKELDHAVEQCSGQGIIVNFGELNALIADSASGCSVSYVVSQLTSLFERHRQNLWLIGAAGTHEMYIKLLARFPTIEKDWDLHLLPITSSKPSIEGFYPKSSLLGSFVPFGGFFSTPSDFKTPLSITNQPFTRCALCNEKYEQEVASIRKLGSTISIADQYSESIPSWLQMAEPDTSKGAEMSKTKDDETMLNSKILGLQKKWNDICQRCHQTRQFPKLDNMLTNSQGPVTGDFQLVGNRIPSCSKDSSPTESRCTNLSPSMPMSSQMIFLSQPNMPIPVSSEADKGDTESKLATEVSTSQQVEVERPQFSPFSTSNLSLQPDSKSSLSFASVTTDLGLGTIYASTSQKSKSPTLQDHKSHLSQFSGSISAELDAVSESGSSQIANSSTRPGSNVGVEFDLKDFKLLRNALSEKVGWQDEAICSISQAVSCYRTGNVRRWGTNFKGDIWLTFLGHDRIGKKKIASALAETIFDSKESLISVDLSSQDNIGESYSIFECQDLNGYDAKFRGKTVVDHIAGELSKKPRALVFLENVDKADLQVQSSLSQAISTGKFPDSHGREISINNMIFVITSANTKVNKTLLLGKELTEFSEEKILEARNWQMQILVGSADVNASRSSGMNVRVTPRKGNSNLSCTNKRKTTYTDGSNSDMHKRVHKVPRSFLDLNLPVEDEEEDISYVDCDSDSMSENSEAWLEDFFNQVKEKVIFKPFDFDTLAEKLLKVIYTNFKRVFGPYIPLEIDHQVMVQILAATWLSETETAIEEWVEHVLNKSFTETQLRYPLNAQSIVKLVAIEGQIESDQAPGICLPAKVKLK